MTEFFAFENLTWPEVQAMPRDTPLVLPLGQGYHMERLASALGEPTRAAILPPIPYGWLGSGLEVPEALLGKLVGNLLDSLRQDGFSRVFALTPQPVELELYEQRIALPGPPRQPALPPDGERGKVILIPIGHTEQHGYHLPLSVDTWCIEAVSLGAAQRIPDLAYSLPVMPYGVSTHRSSFAGTLNAGGRAFEDFWLAVTDLLVRRGFERFYLLSGHGGNCSFLTNVAKYSGERHPHIFCATTWLYLSGPKGIAALEKHRRSAKGGMGHAGELETALMLHLAPELVDMSKVVDEVEFISTPSYAMDWVESGALVANPPWYDDSHTGAYGAGSLATAENGRHWLGAAIEEKIDHVNEIHEQQDRRTAKRKQQHRL